MTTTTSSVLHNLPDLCPRDVEPAGPASSMRAVPLRQPPIAGGCGTPIRADKHLRAWMHQALYDLAPDGPVLAVGRGQGYLAPHLAEYSSDLTVLENGQTGLARQFPDIAFLQHHPSSPLPFAHNTFDAIWCGYYINDVPDPGAAFRELHRVLAPEGRLIVITQNPGMLSTALGLITRTGAMTGADSRFHALTRTMLVKLAQAAGLSEIVTAREKSPRRGAGKLARGDLLLRARKPFARPCSSAACDERVAAAA